MADTSMLAAFTVLLYQLKTPSVAIAALGSCLMPNIILVLSMCCATSTLTYCTLTCYHMFTVCVKMKLPGHCCHSGHLVAILQVNVAQQRLVLCRRAEVAAPKLL